ncbi:MAG: serine O-acetyltransferase [Hyphomicrobiaceae bacterium]|nr:serine O-acetyltransferase [Hyphomicrobiaceae bacterium]
MAPPSAHQNRTAALRQDTAVVTAHDPIWSALRKEAEVASVGEPALGGFLYATVLSHARLEDAVCHRLAQRLNHSDVDAHLIGQTFEQVLKDHPELSEIFRADLQAVFERDPACSRYIEPLLYFKGFHALVTHRFAHELWKEGRHDFALYLQSQASRIFAVDINPATRMGRGIMLDHGTGIVIGETAVIGDNVSILQDVTLGGNGKETGDRHPKIGNNVLLAAGAKVLGNIRVGDCSKVAAGSVVLQDVPANKTVAGVPAKIVGDSGCPEPARSMDQRLGPHDCGCGY